MTMLSGGFIVTSLLWGTALAHLIDGRIRPTAAALLLAGVFSWFGVIHSPLPSGAIMSPGAVIAELESGPGRRVVRPNALPLDGRVRRMAAVVLVLAPRRAAPTVRRPPDVLLARCRQNYPAHGRPTGRPARKPLRYGLGESFGRASHPPVMRTRVRPKRRPCVNVVDGPAVFVRLVFRIRVDLRTEGV